MVNFVSLTVTRCSMLRHGFFGTVWSRWEMTQDSCMGHLIPSYSNFGNGASRADLRFWCWLSFSASWTSHQVGDCIYRCPRQSCSQHAFRTTMNWYPYPPHKKKKPQPLLMLFLSGILPQWPPKQYKLVQGSQWSTIFVRRIVIGRWRDFWEL